MDNKKGLQGVIADEEYARMARFETDHWWYRILHHSIHRVILDSFANNKLIRILDAGCGTGGTQLFLRRQGYHSISGFDLSKQAVAVCKDRNLDVFQEDIRNIANHFHENSIDVIVCSDVLYFLEFDEIEQVIHDFFSILKGDGIVILNLPALNVFKGTHDIAVGIKTRFSKKIVKQLFSSSDFVVRKMYYWPLLLSPLILLVRNFQKIKLSYKKDMHVYSDLKRYPRVVNAMLYGSHKLERLIFGNMSLFGSSLFMYAQKKDG